MRTFANTSLSMLAVLQLIAGICMIFQGPKEGMPASWAIFLGTCQIFVSLVVLIFPYFTNKAQKETELIKKENDFLTSTATLGKTYEY